MVTSLVSLTGLPPHDFGIIDIKGSTRITLFQFLNVASNHIVEGNTECHTGLSSIPHKITEFNNKMLTVMVVPRFSLKNHLLNDFKKLTTLSIDSNTSSKKSLNIGTLFVKFDKTITKGNKISRGVASNSVHKLLILFQNQLV
jgi:hypothetical protein